MRAVRPLLFVIVLFLAVAAAVIVFSDRAPGHIDAVATSEGEYETIALDTTLKDMEKAGYRIGDLVKVSAGGHEFTVTYVKSYAGIGVMGGYLSTSESSGDDRVKLGYFNVDVWKLTGISVGDKLGLDYAGKDPNISRIPNYLAGYNGHYDGSITEEQFCNFREVTGPGLKEGTIYRSVSPYGAGYESTPMVNGLYEDIGMDYIVDIGDDDKKVERCREAYGDDLYSIQLYDSGNAFAEYIFPDINIRPEGIKKVMLALTESEGKTVICCHLGKDRTGFVCAMLQALTGSDYEDLKREYMLSYVYLYNVEDGSEEYETLGKMMFDRCFYLLGHPGIEEQAGHFDWSVIDDYEFDAKAITEKFLREQAKMTDAEMELLMERISKRGLGIIYCTVITVQNQIIFK